MREATPPKESYGVTAEFEPLRSTPAIGRVDFGDLLRIEPISKEWGYDRGEPIDRHYIESFLQRHSADVQGRVLEVGDSTYTYRFGGERVTQSDVLHIKPEAPGATIVADLANADNIPSDAFDCLVLTQTVHLIFDLHAAVRTVHRILKPGGVVLMTVPGMPPIDYGEWGDTWFWSMTVQGVRRLLLERFQSEEVQVESCGNVLAAAAFLYGLSQSDVPFLKDMPNDPHYPVTVLARARKT